MVSPRGTGTRVRDPRCGLADEGCGTLAHSTHREGKHGQKDRSKTFTGKMAQHSAGLAQRVGLCGSLWSLVAALLRVKHTRPAEVCPVTWLRQAGRGSVTSGEGQSGNARQRTAQTPCRSRRAVVQEHRERRPGVSATGWQQRILHVFREKKKRSVLVIQEGPWRRCARRTTTRLCCWSGTRFTALTPRGPHASSAQCAGANQRGKKE